MQSLDKYFMSTYYAPGTALRVGGCAVNRTNHGPNEVACLLWGQTARRWA